MTPEALIVGRTDYREDRLRDGSSFLEKIGRPDLRERITFQSPWVYLSTEIGLSGLECVGGKGFLAGDTISLADKAEIPITGVTLGYSKRWDQRLDGFRQVEDFSDILHDPESEHVGVVEVRANGQVIPIEVYKKSFGKNATVIKLYERGLGEAYGGEKNSAHRLWQETVLSAGGIQALEMLGYKPAFIHLNESDVAFSAALCLDRLCKNGTLPEAAVEEVKHETLLTNHTLVPAASGAFSEDLLEKFPIQNLETDYAREYVRKLIRTNGKGSLDPSDLAIDLSGKQNGVSRKHSQIASELFRRLNGEAVYFEGITNGIDMQRWSPHLTDFYKENGIIDQYQLPVEDFKEKIVRMNEQKFRKITDMAKEKLHQFLPGRRDQYGRPIFLPKDAKIAAWARRFAGYKRPGLLFSDPERLASILERGNIYLILAGKTHPGDEGMKHEMQRILTLIHDNPVLSHMVYFLVNYNESAGQHLTAGADIWINTPRVGEEACGTSSMKGIGSGTMVISTEDGGIADVSGGLPLPIEGKTEDAEAESLYQRLEEAGKIIDQGEQVTIVKEQLYNYLPTIAGGRMLSDYLNFQFPL